jgi:three-Cys-motif partner protein
MDGVTPYESRGLVLNEGDELWARPVRLHSALKAASARGYANIVGTAMRNKWKLWWVELFAGPGHLYVKDEGRFVLGSPLEALAIKHRFHGYVFADLDPRCTGSLSRRIDGEENTFVLTGDANSADLLDQIAAIVPKDALVVLYGDPEGLDLKWETLKYFIDRYPRLDLLLNLPISGVVRALAAGYDEKAAAVLGTDNPYEVIVDGWYEKGARGAMVREFIERRLAAEGFDKIHAVTVNIRRNVGLYDLLLASRHPRAAEFFAAAVNFREARWAAVS